MATMIPAIVSLGALLDENKHLRAELARRDEVYERDQKFIRAQQDGLARRDEQIAAVRAWAERWQASDALDPYASIFMDDAADCIREALDGGAS